MTSQELGNRVRELLLANIRAESGEDSRRHLIEEAVNNNIDAENIFREFLYLHDNLSDIVPRYGFRTRFEGLATSTKGIGITYYDRSNHEGGRRDIGSVLIATDESHSGHLRFYIRGQLNAPPQFEPVLSRGEPEMRYGFQVYNRIAVPNRELSDLYLNTFQDSFSRIGSPR